MAKQKKAGRKQQRSIAALIFVLLLAAGIYAFRDSTADQLAAQLAAVTAQPQLADTEMKAYVLDVGQGDCIFLKGPSGNTMLVDAGTDEMFEVIDAFLREQNIEKLDVVIATHPHADHIGAMDDIIRNYSIDAFYMPGIEHNSKTFENMLDALEDRNVKTYKAIAGHNGSNIEWDEQVHVSFLSPWEEQEYSDLNNWSVVCRLEYEETSLLLAGDAGEDAEEVMLQNFPNESLQSDVLKIGHHGSRTSSTKPFLAAVQPEKTVISLGLDNTYGHPHVETLEQLEEIDAEVFRTDLQGNILITMNGKEFTAEPMD